MKVTIFALGFTLLLALTSVSVTLADSFYYRFVIPPTPTVNCTSDPTHVFIDVTGPVGFNWHLPATDTTIISTYLFNGAPNGTSAFTQSGDGQDTNGGYFASVDGGYPASFAQRFQTVVDGQIVSTSTFQATCSGDGAGTASVSNGAGTGGNGGVLVSGSSAIRDGRINSKNFAPVALYCDGSVLTAYAIDATGGTFAWKFNISGPSDQPLPDALGISLLRAPDVRHSVLATEPDGKQYLFVFDGCPYPGATETYISDPATGQFVRAE